MRIVLSFAISLKSVHAWLGVANGIRTDAANNMGKN
jgi:hypothetical protein